MVRTSAGRGTAWPPAPGFWREGSLGQNKGYELPAHILLVGANLSRLHQMPLFLAQLGHRLTQVDDWEQALEQLELHSDLELIICDRSAPDPAGMGLAHYLSAPHLLSALPVIVVCQESDLTPLRGFLVEGPVDFINEPQSLRELAIRVNKSLIQHRQTQSYLKYNQRDHLTGFSIKQVLQELLPREMIRAQRGEIPLGLLFIDLDHLGEINERHGHLTGNQVLQVFAQRLRSWVRESDLAVRYGGGEFVLVTPGAGAEGVNILGHRIRQSMERPVQTRSGDIEVTLSLGAAVYDLNTKLSPDEFIGLAEKACYKAKDQGRNRLVMAG